MHYIDKLFLVIAQLALKCSPVGLRTGAVFYFGLGMCVYALGFFLDPLPSALGQIAGWFCVLFGGAVCLLAISVEHDLRSTPVNEKLELAVRKGEERDNLQFPRKD